MQAEAKKLTGFQIASTYVGTVIGAGFASGQEILQFFGVFGRKGLLGLIAVTAFFILYGYIIMELGYRIKSASYIEIIRLSGGKYFSILADYIISFFLFGSVTTMIAASGALFYQQYGVHSAIGGISMTVITVIVVFMGIGSLVNSMSIMVPVLLVVSAGTGILTLFVVKFGPGIAEPVSSTRLVGNWLWSAILYVSYNIATAIAVLGPLGKEAQSRRAVREGAVWGGLALGVCAFAIYLAESRYGSIPGNVELPMLFISGSISPILQAAYSLVLLIAIFSTSAGSLYGLASRIFDMGVSKGRAKIIWIAILAFLAGLFGFSNLIKYVYPIEGYLGLVLLLGLLYSKGKSSI